MPVRTERVQLAGGQAGLRWGAVDELLECEWSVVLTPLANGVAVQVTLQNHSDRPQPGYWWTNIAVPAKQGTRLFYHPGPVLHHGCDMGMLYEQWPQLNGNDWQYWQNHSGIISAYWPEYGSDVFGYAPPGEGWAMVHHADRRVMSRAQALVGWLRPRRRCLDGPGGRSIRRVLLRNPIRPPADPARGRFARPAHPPDLGRVLFHHPLSERR